MKREDLKKIKFMNSESLKELGIWVITSLILFTIIEYLSRGTFRGIFEFFKNNPVEAIMNIILIFMITGFSFLFKHKKAVLVVISFLILALGLINKMILVFRGMPIAFMDIFSIGDGLSIASKFINAKVIIIALIVIIIAVAGFLFMWKLDKDSCRFNGVGNITIWIVTIVVFLGALGPLRKLEYLANVPWNVQVSYETNGFLYSFLESYFGYLRKEPDGYNEENIKKIKAEVDKKEKEDKRVIKSEKNAPNILVVQLEGFLDPTKMPDVKLSFDPIPNFRKLMRENSSGYMNVPSTGGGTARTEFEMLTGSNFDYLLSGEIPYTSIIKERTANSLATTLKKQGFGVEAVHNFKGNFYNRDKGYENMGFDRFTSIEYMDGMEYTKLNWPKDFILTKYIKKSLDSTKTKDFVSTISVQAHSYFPKRKIETWYPCQVEGNIPREQKDQIYYYCQQIREMDQFVKQLNDMLVERKKQTGEDSIILYYGDHMPNLDYLYGEEEVLDRYKTPYTFFSTYKIPRVENGIKESYEIGEKMLKMAGLKYGPVEKLHAYLRNDKDYKKKMELVQYDLLFGEKYYLNDDEVQKEQKMKMGIDEIKIKDVKVQGTTLVVDGENFTKASAIYVNDQKLDTTFVKTKRVTAKIEKDSVKKGDKIVIKQLGESDVPLSSTKEYKLKKD